MWLYRAVFKLPVALKPGANDPRPTVAACVDDACPPANVTRRA